MKKLSHRIQYAGGAMKALALTLTSAALLLAAGCSKEEPPEPEAKPRAEVLDISDKTKAGLDKIENASEEGQSDIDSFDAPKKQD